MAADLRELTFQNVLDTVLTPAGVKVGGFPEDIFTDLTDYEKEAWSCNICLLLLKEARQCDNKHHFCHTCIFAWSLTLGANSQKCPVCRCEQRSYLLDKELDQCMGEKRVNCPEIGCSFASPLKILLMHSHGKIKYSNIHVDLESLRPPPQQMFIHAAANSLPLRTQLTQGRMMINQMLVLLQLEMQLRQHALFNFTNSNDHTSRMRHADEMIALNEQLGEVGGMLGNLLNDSIIDAPARRANRRDHTQYTNSSMERNLPSTNRSQMPRVLSFLEADRTNNNHDASDPSSESLVTSPRPPAVQLSSSRAHSRTNSTTSEDDTTAVRAPLSNPSGTILVFRRDRPPSHQNHREDSAYVENTNEVTAPREHVTTTLPPITAPSETQRLTQVQSRVPSRESLHGTQHSPPSYNTIRPSQPHPSSISPPVLSEDGLATGSVLPTGSTTLRDAMQAMNSDTPTTTQRRTARIRPLNHSQCSVTRLLVSNISQVPMHEAVHEEEGSQENERGNVVTTEQLYDSIGITRSETPSQNTERPSTRNMGQRQSTYSPQRRFRRQGNKPIRASHDIDVANMNRLTNRNTTSRGITRAADTPGITSDHQRNTSISKRHASTTARHRTEPRDSSPVPRPRRRSEIREELLKSRSKRD